MKRIERKLEYEIHEIQAGFRRGRGTRDHIFNMRNIFKKCREYNVDLHSCCVDYTKAFDNVQHQKLWNKMKDMRLPSHLIHLIETLYYEQQAVV
uniref:Reverse transcriptase domain-containing protein n=1 Tax=Arion vulgaris TaxID=1028688 RepID=A0A0B7A9Q1_9EUPU